jgi:hypothetical protein
MKKVLIAAMAAVLVATAAHAEVRGEVDTGLHQDYNAAKRNASPAKKHDLCVRLGWTRGVHFERANADGGSEEMTNWMDYCTANFNSIDFQDASSSYRR